MKRTILSLATLLVASTAYGQDSASSGYVPGDVPGPYYGYRTQPHHASTVYEGYLRGAADYVRAWGEYAVNKTRSMINYEEARSRYIDNRVKGVEARFTMRRMNREYRAAERGPRPTQEQLTEIAHAAAPDRPSAHQLDPISGEIYWPEALLGKQYDRYRELLGRLFAERPHVANGQGTRNYTAIQFVSKAMEERLKLHVRQFDPGSYIAAKRFIEGLAYEARYAPVQPVAAK